MLPAPRSRPRSGCREVCARLVMTDTALWQRSPSTAQRLYIGGKSESKRSIYRRSEVIALAYATTNAHVSSAAHQQQVVRMRPLGKLVALSYFVVGVIGAVEPAHLIAMVQYLLTPPGLHTGAVLHVVMGFVLIFVAPISRAPWTARIIGGLILGGGFVTPLVGDERPRVVADWAAAQSPWMLRGIGGLLGAIGALIGFVTDPRADPRVRQD
jgi:hypothetical protein